MRLGCLRAHGGHEGVQDAHSESGATGEGLSEIELSVGVVVIVLVQELDVAVVDQHGDHRNTGAVPRAWAWPRSRLTVSEVVEDVSGVCH